MKNTVINNPNTAMNEVLNFTDDNYYCGGCGMIGFIDDEYYNIFGWGKKAKAKKAERKEAKADKAEAKGNPEKAARLRARAEQLRQKAGTALLTAAESVELKLAEQGLDINEGTVDKSGAIVIDEGTGAGTEKSKIGKILMWSGIGVGVLAVGFILYKVLRPKKA